MLKDHLDIIEQATELLHGISERDYVSVLSPLFNSSVGDHLRHIADHYLALMAGCEKATVDYNTRHRESPVAMDIQAALALFERIGEWLGSLQPSQVDNPMTVVSEVSISHTANESTRSSLGRELVFVSSHAIHHFSLIAAMRKLQGSEVPEHLGVAPATLSFQRQSAG